jgi:hypothetical protein
MGFAASARNAFIGAAATVAAALPLSHADAQSRAVPTNSRPAASAPMRSINDSTIRRNTQAEALNASKDYGMITFFVLKGGKSDYARSAEEVAEILKGHLKRVHGVNSMAFSENSKGNGVGVTVSFYVNGSLVDDFNLNDAVKPEVIRSVIRTYNAVYVASNRNDGPQIPKND